MSRVVFKGTNASYTYGNYRFERNVPRDDIPDDIVRKLASVEGFRLVKAAVVAEGPVTVRKKGLTFGSTGEVTELDTGAVRLSTPEGAPPVTPALRLTGDEMPDEPSQIQLPDLPARGFRVKGDAIHYASRYLDLQLDESVSLRTLNNRIEERYKSILGIEQRPVDLDVETDEEDDLDVVV